MSNSTKGARARLLFEAAEMDYDFGAEHPLQPKRLQAMIDLMETSGLWHAADEQTCLQGHVATPEELALIHTPDYIAAVQSLSKPAAAFTSTEEGRKWDELALHYGFDDGDTPALPGMHQVVARIAGGTLVALSAVMGLAEGGTFATEDERPLHVFHPAGGWHHAWKERASGFCVYNDSAVAIAHVLRASEAKVLYIDFDAHHGDGVQRAFYDDPRVMTVSLHETGRYLFPGTGDVLELGTGSGRGYSVNVPLEPFTEDDSYSEVMNTLLPPLAASFAPDVIVSAHGCDTHAWDPLTHLQLTMRGILAQVKLAHQLAHAYCRGRWVAVGGGGYDPYRVVPRAWSMLWAEMIGQSLPEKLPVEWIKRWKPVWTAAQVQEKEELDVMEKAPMQENFPATFQDQAEDFPPQPRRWSINSINRQTAAMVRHLAVPSFVRHAFPTVRHHRSPLTDMFDLLHLHRSQTPSRTRELATHHGTLLMRDFCPPSLVERMDVEGGMHAFTRSAELEHQLLLDIAKSPDCALALAHTSEGEIVGQSTMAPADTWWEGIDNAYEIAVEVSSNWRGLGVARNLLTFALELDALEDLILFALGLAWHWDVEGLGIPLYSYRRLIAHLFGTQGFVEYETTEPNVSMGPGNILLARIGNRVEPHSADQFLKRLMRSPVLNRL